MEHEFPHAVIRQAYELADHRCQCTDPRCSHHAGGDGRCSRVLRWAARGNGDSWQVSHIHPVGPGIISNCRVLCDKCYKHEMALRQRGEAVGKHAPVFIVVPASV